MAEPITWKCLGDVAGQRWSSLGGDAAWGDVKPGHADPQATGEGLASSASGVASTSVAPTCRSADYDDGGFLGLVQPARGAGAPSGAGVGDESDFVRMLTAGPSVDDIVATTEAEAGPDSLPSRLATVATEWTCSTLPLWPRWTSSLHRLPAETPGFKTR